ELPGERGQFRRLDAQFEPQPFTLLCRLMVTHIVAAAHLAREKRTEQLPAKILYSLLFRRQHLAASPAGAQQRDLQSLEAVLQRELVKGEAHRFARFAGRRVDDSNGILASSARADLQLEIEITQMSRTRRIAISRHPAPRVSHHFTEVRAFSATPT